MREYSENELEIDNSSAGFKDVINLIKNEIGHVIGIAF